MAPPVDMTGSMNIGDASGLPPSTPLPRPAKMSRPEYLSWLAGRHKLQRNNHDHLRIQPPGILSPRGELIATNPHELLIRGYGIAEENGQVAFQPRMTLNQYLYSHLENTSDRDKDQVIYRYTRDTPGEVPKIFMVDQMWLWIINGGLSNPDGKDLTASTNAAIPDTLITCIPNRWEEGSSNSRAALAAVVAGEELVRGPSIEHGARPGLLHEPLMSTAHGRPNLVTETAEPMIEPTDVEPINEEDMSTWPRHAQGSPAKTKLKRLKAKPQGADDPMSIQHKVLRHLKETSRKPIESIHDLAGLVATCCASVFDETQIPEEMQFLDFFEHSISSLVRSPLFAWDMTITDQTQNEKATRGLHEFRAGLNSNHVHPNKLAFRGGEATDKELNILTDIDLLVEIEDIQDELRILKRVLADQRATLRRLRKILVQAKRKSGLTRYEGESFHSIVDTSCIDNQTLRIDEMEKLAVKANKSVSS